MLTPTQELSTYVYPGTDAFVQHEAEKFCPILKLPNEVLLRIFRLIEDAADLDPLPLVSRLWRSVAKDNALWSETRLIKSFLTPEEIKRQGLKQRLFLAPVYTPSKELFAQLDAEESLGDFFNELAKARAEYNKVKYLW